MTTGYLLLTSPGSSFLAHALIFSLCVALVTADSPTVAAHGGTHNGLTGENVKDIPSDRLETVGTKSYVNCDLAVSDGCKLLGHSRYGCRSGVQVMNDVTQVLTTLPSICVCDNVSTGELAGRARSTILLVRPWVTHTHTDIAPSAIRRFRVCFVWAAARRRQRNTTANHVRLTAYGID